MAKNRFYRDTPVGAIQKVIDTRNAQKDEATALVVVVDTIGACHVQLRGASNFTPVDTSEGIKVSVGDHVLLRRNSDTNKWLIFQNFGSSKSTNSTGGISPSATGITPVAPTGFLAWGEADGILFTWIPLAPDGGFVYEIDVADDTSDTHSIIHQVSGSAWYLHIVGTHSCRIRSVGLDWARSGWTDWLTVTALDTSIINFDVILTDRDGNVLVDRNGNVLVRD